MMKKWLRRIRGAVGMGLTWALVWAPVAVLIGFLVDPDGSMDEMWPAIGAYPGFLGGVVFSVVLAVAARRRRLEELSVGRVALWGAAAGLLVGVLPFTIGEPTTDVPLWLLATVVIGTITLLSAASAAGSLALARMAEKRALGAGGNAAAVGAGIGSRTMIGRQRRGDVAGVESRAAAATAARPSSR
jgi:peptidoglycan/LPS O-acetylase OafA/YrhL